VFSGVAGGIALSAVAYYFISLRQAFGGVTPIDQNSRWQALTEERKNGRWVRPWLPAAPAPVAP